MDRTHHADKALVSILCHHDPHIFQGSHRQYQMGTEQTLHHQKHHVRAAVFDGCSRPFRGYDGGSDLLSQNWNARSQLDPVYRDFFITPCHSVFYEKIRDRCDE